nr:autophagy-related protein 16-like [Ipomoea batatas]GME11775.1 autophagy-related protein 16-like [Ipomoea batatas]
MQQVEEHQPTNPPSPPRKKAKIQPNKPCPNTLIHKIKSHHAQCNSILFLNTPNHLVSGGRDNNSDNDHNPSLKIWDTLTASFLNSLDGFNGFVSADLAFNPTSNLLVAGLSTHKLCVWDLNHSTQPRRTLIGHDQKICAVDISQFTGQVVIGAAANSHVLKAWDLSRDTEIRSTCYPWISSYISSPCNTLRFTKDDTIFCSGHVNGTVNFTNIDRFFTRSIGEIAAHTQSVTSICAMQDGNVVLSSGRDNVHNVIDVRVMKVCGKLKSKGVKVVARTCVSPCGEYAAVGSAEGVVYVWSIKMGKMVGALKGHGGPVVCCSWSSGGSPLASCDSDGNICIWS